MLGKFLVEGYGPNDRIERYGMATDICAPIDGPRASENSTNLGTGTVLAGQTCMNIQAARRGRCPHMPRVVRWPGP
jgi:hypothetical protein